MCSYLRFITNCL